MNNIPSIYKYVLTDGFKLRIISENRERNQFVIGVFWPYIEDEIIDSLNTYELQQRVTVAFLLTPECV